MFLVLVICFYFCQFLKIVWVIIQTDSTSTSNFLVLIVLFSLKCLQLTKFRAKCYRYFISLEFCEHIREKCDEFLNFILHALFHTVILIYILHYSKSFSPYISVIFVLLVNIKY